MQLCNPSYVLNKMAFGQQLGHLQVTIGSNYPLISNQVNPIITALPITLQKFWVIIATWQNNGKLFELLNYFSFFMGMWYFILLDKNVFFTMV